MLAKRLIYGLLLGVTAGPPLTPPVGGGLSRLAPPVGGDDDCHAQDSLLLRDYQFVKQYDGWLTSSNAAGLNRYNRANIGEAKLSLSHEEGGLTDYFESPSATQLSAATESFYRISERAVVFGRIAYDNFSGKEMAGSAFIDPTRRPFDIVEDSLTNTGKKHRDTYQLTGAVGMDVWRGLALGLRLDYTAANYAKYKDLRHKNKLMDLTASAGLYLPLARFANVGANYLYHRNTESITFGTYGKSDKVYQSLINYGNFIGQVEQFGSYGFTDKSREMPLFDESHGLAVQLELTPLKRLTFLNQFTYARHNGYYGRKSPYTITFTNHHADSYTYQGTLALQGRQSLHQLMLSVEAENLQNNANNYRELQNEAGSYYYEYYDDVKTANKLWVNTHIAYTAHLGIRHELPIWTLRAAVNTMHRKQTAYVYPYFRRQTLDNTTLQLEGTRNVILKKGVLSVSANLSYQKGSGEPYEDDTFIPPSDKQTAPPEMAAYLWREYQYLTAAQYGIGGSVRYAFIFPETRLNTHLQLGIHHRKANETFYYSNGKDHTQVSLAIGCQF